MLALALPQPLPLPYYLHEAPQRARKGTQRKGTLIHIVLVSFLFLSVLPFSSPFEDQSIAILSCLVLL